MYPMIIFRMAQLKMKQIGLARKIGMKPDTFYNKWDGTLCFSGVEQRRIRTALEWEEMPLDILFMKRETTIELFAEITDAFRRMRNNG